MFQYDGEHWSLMCLSNFSVWEDKYAKYIDSWFTLWPNDGSNEIRYTAWKVSKYGVFSGPYFPAFGPEKTPYLETFHAVIKV